MTGSANSTITWAAKALAKRLEKAGYDAKPVDHGYAVKIHDSGGALLSTVWFPIGEPTPTGLGHVFLWGPTGDEHQAPDSTDPVDLVRLIVETLPEAAPAKGSPGTAVLLNASKHRYHSIVPLPHGVKTVCGANARDMQRVLESEARERFRAAPCVRCWG